MTEWFGYIDTMKKPKLEYF